MVYVKADVPDDVHTKLRMKAAKENVRIEDIVAKQLIEVNADG